MDDLTVGVVLGNGPSRDLFDYQGDCIIGCNIPGEDFSVDATIITDIEVVWVLKNNPDLITCPVIASTTAYAKMQELRVDRDIEVIEVFNPRDWHTSGHYATLYLADVIKCDIIRIWGCDSYYVDDSTSYTDNILPKTGDVFYKQWRRSWNEIFHAHPNTLFDIKRL